MNGTPKGPSAETMATLFDLDAIAGPDPYNGHPPPKSGPCTPARVGSGPAGHTCGDCGHRARLQYANTYQKCGLMQHVWTGGAATDIRVAWAACREWIPETEGA